MSKQSKILILITSLALALVLYLVFSSEVVVVSEKKADKNQAVTEDKITSADIEIYKNKIRKIIDDFESLVAQISNNIPENADQSDSDIASSSENNFDAYKNMLSDLIARLENMVVPSDSFKEVHLKLRIAFSKLENYFFDENPENLMNSIESVSQLKINNDWLNE